MNGSPDPISAGARAATLLEEACRPEAVSPNAQQTEVVRDLAVDLGRQLETLSGLARTDPTPDVLAEAAICCADLANLAACNAGNLPPEYTPRAVEATRLAAEAVHSMTPLVESGSGELEADHAENLLRDVRSSSWRAQFAVRLVEGPPDEPSPG